ncbi:unnamed protein product [Caenorhabditis bovis]|uniref:Uncharacterized protein n=1 Tax=Caenorhabditis bovis TaxID=2654633 RepID=A0A8S1EN79_9PELO|nr:unnamed protein product [Caenorhabditis bovis]
MYRQQSSSTIRRARFDAVNCVMYMNGYPQNDAIPHNRHDRESKLTRSTSTIDSSDSAIRKLKRENHHLKKTLSRRWSSRSRSSMASQMVISDDEEDQEDVDDSLYLLRETSTLHGLRDVLLSSSSHLKSVWVMIVVMAIFLTLHGCYQILQEYSLRRIVVSYFIQEAATLPLPDVVICPYNRFNRSFLEANNVSFELAQYLELSYPSLEMPFNFLRDKQNEIIDHVDMYDYELELLLQKMGNVSYVNFLQQATLGCEAFFKEPGRCDNITEIMTSAGKCFRFPGSHQEASGFGNGDRLLIHLPEELYNPGVNQMINHGVIVKLAESGKGIDNDLTFLPAGVHAIMPLLGTQYEFMHDPPRYECEEDKNGSYSRVWCYEDCLTYEAQIRCNCSPAAATHPAHPNSICTAKQLYHCFFLSLFDKYDTKVAECKKRCKPPCHAWSYHKQVSYSTIPSSTTLLMMENEQEWNELKSMIVLDVYYSQLDYTIIKHVIAMPLQSLIAQIGGQFSLWAGGSLISLCQIIIYLSRFFFHRCSMKKRRTKAPKPANSQPSSPEKCNGKPLNMEIVKRNSNSMDGMSRVGSVSINLDDVFGALPPVNVTNIEPAVTTRKSTESNVSTVKDAKITSFDETYVTQTVTTNYLPETAPRYSFHQYDEPPKQDDGLLDSIFGAVQLPEVHLNKHHEAIRQIDDVLAAEETDGRESIVSEPNYRAPSHVASSKVSSHPASHVSSNAQKSSAVYVSENHPQNTGSVHSSHVYSSYAPETHDYDDEKHDLFDHAYNYQQSTHMQRRSSRANTIDSAVSYSESRIGQFDVVHDDNSSVMNLNHDEVAYNRPYNFQTPQSTISKKSYKSFHTGDTAKLRRINIEIANAHSKRSQLSNQLDRQKIDIERLKQQNLALEATLKVNRNGNVNKPVAYNYRSYSQDNSSYHTAKSITSHHSTKSVDSSIYEEEEVRVSPLAARQKAAGEHIATHGKYSLIVPQYYVVDNFSENSKINKVVIGGDAKPTDDDKTILLFGPIGSGKTSIIASMMNYLYDVKKENDFRFVLDEYVSHTTGLTAYVFNNSVLSYNVTVVDTPGIVDKMGDKTVSKLIKQWFEQELLREKAFRLDAISIVLKHDESQLGWPFIYELADVKKMFGDDLKTNVMPIITHAEVLPQPIAIKSLTQANISFLNYYKVNNAGFSTNPKGINKLKHNLFWTHGISSLESLFQDLQEQVHPLVAILRHNKGQKVEPSTKIANATLY